MFGPEKPNFLPLMENQGEFRLENYENKFTWIQRKSTQVSYGNPVTYIDGS